MYISYYESPIGTIEITATDEALTSLVFREAIQPIKNNPILSATSAQLDEYFNGERRSFNLPLTATGTEFQRRVWCQLRAIPYGETRSYSDIANNLNNPKAVRAVGSANGKNPISIIVPCHRVIGSNGRLTGYAWGTDKKAWLLKHEAANRANSE